MLEERICAHCGELLEPGTPAVFNFATGEGWHYNCPNPMGGVNGWLDTRPTPERE